jgi:protein SCO1
MPARVRLALMVVATLVIATAAGVVLFARPGAGAPAAGFAGATAPSGIPPRDFRLRDESGRAVSLADLRGRVVVLTFLFSTCRDVCPLTATQIRGALDQLGHDVPVLAVSVDPAGDTPRTARRFLARRGLAGGRMRFLLGGRAELEPIWRAYGIRPQGDGFDHSAHVLLIDRRGRRRVGFPVAQLTPEGLTHDIRLLEAERFG